MTEAERQGAPEPAQPTAPEANPGSDTAPAATPDPAPDAPDPEAIEADPGEAFPGETAEQREARLNSMPEYKGDPLDAERGPGLGCFWIQIGLLTFFLILTPLTVTWGWDPFISGALLIFTLILLLFSGQTIIFLLRLVAADRRTRRAPLDPSAKPTVGQMEDAGSPTPAAQVPTTAEPTDAASAKADDDD